LRIGFAAAVATTYRMSPVVPVDIDLSGNVK
jgi:hypothetical protein